MSSTESPPPATGPRTAAAARLAAASALRSLVLDVLNDANDMLLENTDVEAVVMAMMREHCYDEASLRVVMRRDSCFTRFMNRVPEAPVPLWAASDGGGSSSVPLAAGLSFHPRQSSGSGAGAVSV